MSCVACVKKYYDKHVGVSMFYHVTHSGYTLNKKIFDFDCWTSSKVHYTNSKNMM